MSSTHPLFNIDDISYPSLWLDKIFRNFLIRFWLVSSFEIASEVLKECDFLLKSRWIVLQSILFANILTIYSSTLHVVEMEAVRIKHDFGCIVEEHSSWLVAEMVPETIFTWVINPFLHPYFFASFAIYFDFFSGFYRSCQSVSLTVKTHISYWLSGWHLVSICSVDGCRSRLTHSISIINSCYWLTICWEELSDIGGRGWACKSGSR